MKARAVVRDVGRVMEFPISEVDRVAKLIPATLDMTLDKAIEEIPALAANSSAKTNACATCSKSRAGSKA